MTIFIIRRLLQTLIVLAAMSFLVFIGIYAIGNPVRVLLAPDATEIEIQDAIQRLGLDQPWWIQYLKFLGHALQGNLGESFVNSVPATDLILERLPATFELAVVAMFLAVVLGIPLGLVAGMKSRSAIGRLIMGGSIFGFSVPTFWLGLIMIMFFSAHLGWLPSFGRGPTTDVLGIPISILTWEGLKHILMPAFNLAIFMIALVIRLTRSGVNEILLTDYIKFARAKGLSNARVVVVHILKNIMIPVVTVLGLQFGLVIAFAIVTESIFSWPGMGKLLIDSIYLLDRPVIVAYLLLTVIIFTVINLVVDVAYCFLDPRVRLERLQ